MSKIIAIQSKFSDINTLFMGSLIDHITAYFYAFVAPIIAPLFFPNYDFALQATLIYAVLASSIITKPLGAMLFGYFAAYKNPKIALVWTLLGSAIAAILFSVLPTQQQVGSFAIVGLVFTQALHSMCTSGESAIAKLYTVDQKSKHDAFKNSAIYDVITILGTVCASIMVSLIVAGVIPLSTWRVGFLLNGIMGLIIAGLRFFQYINQHNNLKHTNINAITAKIPEFSKLPSISTVLDPESFKNLNILKKPQTYDFFKKISNFSTLIKLILTNKISILQIMVIYGVWYIAYSIPFVFLNTFIPMVTKIKLLPMLVNNNFLLIIDAIIALIVWRKLSEFNTKQIILLASTVLLVSILPIFIILQYNPSIFIVTCLKLWLIFWGVIFACPVKFWCEELLTNLPEKYFVMALGSALGNGLIGKTSMGICFYLWHKTNNAIMPALYVSGIIAISISTVVLPSFLRYLENHNMFKNPVA